MEQPSPTNDSKHLQEDTERAISRAAAEQEERSPEALLNAVCKSTRRHRQAETRQKGIPKICVAQIYCVCVCVLYRMARLTLTTTRRETERCR